MKSQPAIFRRLLIAVSLHCAAVPCPASDLAARYPATLDHSEASRGYEWVCEEEDVWQLSGFSYALDGEFRVTVGRSQAVFGCHGTNVLWAAVFPEKPGEIELAGHGRGEHVDSIWMRFHPARVSELFPANTVGAQGDPALLARAKRLAGHKMRSCWQSGGRPMVPQRQSITIDVETEEGPRRFYSIDSEAGTVQYVDAFRHKTLPKLKPIAPEDARSAFDAVWDAFDREYAMFVIKPNIDWNQLSAEYRPRAEKAKTSYELGVVIAEMLAKLEDLHVYVQVDGEQLPGYSRHRPLNASAGAISHLVGQLNETEEDLAWGKTGDGIGYINIYRLASPRLPQAFDDALAQMGDTKGLILDLRFNGGGSEPLGQEIAGCFLDQPRVYSVHQYRSGPKHNDLGAKRERACDGGGPWHYTAPVIVLQGQKTMSSAESFLLMLAQCAQVTTMGDRTAGSSGNPRRVEAGSGIVVNLPRWLDMDPEGNPIDRVGIAPKIQVDAKPDDFTNQNDPVLASAISHLRGLPEPDAAGRSAVLRRRPSSRKPVVRPGDADLQLDSPVSTGKRRALIVCGHPGDEAHREMYARSVETLVAALVDRHGFAGDDVWVRFGSQSREGDGSAVSSCRGPSTREAIAADVAELGDVLRTDDTLWVIVLGHAHFDGRHSFLNLPGPDIPEDEFGKLFEALESREQVFFITTPVSGYFIKHLSRKGRIVITATEADLEVNETLFHLDLADVLSEPPGNDQFDKDGDHVITILDLYLTIARRVLLRYKAEKNIPTEHAQLDDNGDGRGTEVQLDYLEPELGGRHRRGGSTTVKRQGDGAVAAKTKLVIESGSLGEFQAQPAGEDR